MKLEPVPPSRQAAELRHTLRTPINHMIGYAELLLEESKHPEGSEPLLSKIVVAAQQVLALVQHHLQTGEGEAAPSDLDALVQSIAEPLRSVIEATDELGRIESGHRLRDVERIRIAAEEVRSFATGTRSAESVNLAVSGTSICLETNTRLVGKFLVVDDSELSREMLCRILERQGHTCVTAANGSEAFERLNTETFDLLLLDLMMPDMSGIEVLQNVRSNPSLQDMAVVMLSAFDEVADIGRCFEMGAEDYLLKPFDRVVLNARLQAVLERRRLRNLERQRTIQLELAEAELIRSNEELRRFASVVSHDLQEPLRMVTSYMQLLERSLGESLTQRQKEYLNYAIDGGRRMSALIKDLLAYSRITEGEPKKELVDIGTVLEDVKSDLRAAIEDSQATILESPLPKLMADYSHVRQVFQNLLGNAIKYKREDPPVIKIVAERCDGRWLFSVADNGIGIEQQYQQRVFDMFSRLQDGSTPGTGIGLAICQRAIELLGGRIWVESEPGRGSTFFFTVPDMRPQLNTVAEER
jgi:light-regulated signal transduction histidine kinase (bacteriophytochrome)